MKQCKGPCGLLKDESAFRIHKGKANKDGRSYQWVVGICKDCENASARTSNRVANMTEEQIRNKTEKRKEQDRIRNQKPERKDWKNNSPKGRMGRYKKGAVERGLLFNLTFEKFVEITKQPCIYCGEFNPDKDFCGIDRVNSDNGYEPSNVAPCCSICNTMKWNYTADFMAEHMIKILKHLKKI